ncbi:unnamed protein product [Boreogadus saida]
MKTCPGQSQSMKPCCLKTSEWTADYKGCMSSGTARVKLLTADQRRAEFPLVKNHYAGQTSPLVSLELRAQLVRSANIEGV